MKYKSMIIVITCVFIVGLCMGLSLIKYINVEQINMVYINEVVMSVEKGEQFSKPKVYEFDVIKNNSNYFNEALNDATKNRQTIVDVPTSNGDEIKIIFYTGFTDLEKQLSTALFSVVTITFALLLGICVFYTVYFEHTIYKPFNKLKRFAQSIAAGNLDIPLGMDKNNGFGAFTESFDIMREELKMAKLKENQANISKRELIASLSHDIKTPVASIKAVSELLLAISKDEKLQNKYVIINEKAGKIDRLIADMFNATLEELGELKVTIAEHYSTELQVLVRNCDYENRVTMHHIPRCLIKVDLLRLGQVLDNVFTNSYKYADTPIDITFSLTELYLEMNIHDFGKGISESEQTVIFNKFYRGDNVGTKSGSGLGLYISKYLMERQDGNITCFNHNNGLTVKLLIKLCS